MITKRIIPCLDIKNGRVVKGTNFQGLSDVSSPIELAKHYSDCGADELVFYDITASAEGRQLDGGGNIGKALEIGAFHHPAVAHVQAGNDAFCDHFATSKASFKSMAPV